MEGPRSRKNNVASTRKITSTRTNIFTSTHKYTNVLTQADDEVRKERKGRNETTSDETKKRWVAMGLRTISSKALEQMPQRQTKPSGAYPQNLYSSEPNHKDSADGSTQNPAKRKTNKAGTRRVEKEGGASTRNDWKGEKR